MSPWVPKLSKLSSGAKPKPADADSVCDSNYAMSCVGDPTNVDSNDIHPSRTKSEGPVNLNLNDEVVNSLSGVEGVELFTDPEAPHVAAKVEQQWNEYSQKHAVEQAPRKVEPKTSLLKNRVLLVLGVLVVASVAIAVGIMVSTKPSTPSSAGTDLVYSPVTFSPADVPVNPPASAPDDAKPATPTMAPSVPTSAPSVEVAETTAVPTVASGGNAPDEGQQGENNGGQGDDAPNDDATDQGQQGENIGGQGEDAPNEDATDQGQQGENNGGQGEDAPNEDATDQDQQGENNGGQGEGGPNEDAPDEGQQGENNGDQGEDRPNDNGTDQGQQGENNGGLDEGAPGEGNQDNAGEQDKEGEQDKNGEGAPK